MKKMISCSILVLFLLLTACSHKIEVAERENYTPPLIKYQPKMFYPTEAQENFYYGITKVVVMISKDGTVNRAVIIKSSKHEILDKAVVDYCKKLTFTPAKLNGEPIDSRIIWEVKFNFRDQKKNTNSYLLAIHKLYLRAKLAQPELKAKIEQDILHEHNNFVKNMSDAINFSNVLEEIITPELANQWKEVWNSWPLSFLLYEDFIERFPDYDSLSVVKQLLKNAASFDINYIQNQPAIGTSAQNQKENIILKIRQFLQSKYPDLVIDNNQVKTNTDFINML